MDKSKVKVKAAKKAKKANPLDPWTQSHINAYVNRTAQNIITPEMKVVSDQIQQTLKDEGGQAKTVGGYSKAAAGIAKGVAPEIQAGFDTAAQQTAGFASGLKQAQAMTQGQDQSAIEGILGNVGAPAAAAAQAAGKAGGEDNLNYLYTTGGYLPAASLEAQGAQQAGAAAVLPATLMGRGQQGIQALAGAAQTAINQLRQKQVEIGMTLPSVKDQVRTQVMAQEIDKAKNINDMAIAAQKAQEFYDSLKERSAYQGGLLNEKSRHDQATEQAAAVNAKTAQLKLKGTTSNYLAQANTAALSVINDAIKPSQTQYHMVPEKKWVTNSDVKTAVAQPYVWVKTGNMVRKPYGKSGRAATYQQALNRVVIAVSPYLSNLGMKPNQIYKYSTQVVNQYYSPGQFGRPGGVKKTTAKSQATTPSLPMPPFLSSSSGTTQPKTQPKKTSTPVTLTNTKTGKTQKVKVG